MSDMDLEEEAAKFALSSMADARDHFMQFRDLFPPGKVLIHKEHLGWVAAGVFEFPNDLKDFGEAINYLLKELDCDAVVIVQDTILSIEGDDAEITPAILGVAITEWMSKAWILTYYEEDNQFHFAKSAEELDDDALQGGYILECITAMRPEMPEGTMLQ